jgi:hypothetical protein
MHSPDPHPMSAGRLISDRCRFCGVITRLQVTPFVCYTISLINTYEHNEFYVPESFVWRAAEESLISKCWFDRDLTLSACFKQALRVSADHQVC